MINDGKSRLNKSMDNLFGYALKEGVFSGAAVGIYHEGKRIIQTFGTTRKDLNGVNITSDTFFDLASLTKPLCTLLSVLCLIEEKKLYFSSLLPEMSACEIDRSYIHISLEHLLSHSAGLPAYRPYYLSFSPTVKFDNKQRLIRAILAEKLEYSPGAKCVYSDLGYILLGEIIEHQSSQSLAEFFRQKVVQPLGLEDKLIFRPVEGSITPRENIAATEQCSWRGRMLQGEVHDEHCWLLNGAAGHAGLFGTIEGVLSMVVHLLGQCRGKTGHPGYSNELLRKCTVRKYRDQTWCMGFDTPSVSGSSAGKYMGASSIGHLGFTGTSLWIDPDRDLVVVLLTNRVHPSRRNEAIKKFRPVFHDKIMQVLYDK